MIAILEDMHPQQFQSDRGLALFEYTRFTKLVAAMVTKRKTCLTSESWKTVPWAHAKHTKDSMQNLVDLMCEMVELQSDLYVLAPYLEDDYDLSARSREKTRTLVSKLHDWRRSTDSVLKSRLKAKEPSTKPNMSREGNSSMIQLEKAMCLCELGIFNMILIYLCRLLPQRHLFDEAADARASDASNASRKYSAEVWLAMRMTPLELPVEDPHKRARIAAKEISMIWEVSVVHELVGIATIYLGLPMLVARNVLAHLGDNTFKTLDKALIQIPGFWSGPG